MFPKDLDSLQLIMIYAVNDASKTKKKKKKKRNIVYDQASSDFRLGDSMIGAKWLFFRSAGPQNIKASGIGIIIAARQPSNVPAH